MQRAGRLEKLPPYLFARIEEKIEKQKRKGVDVISLGIGDPDLPTPQRVVSALRRAAQDPRNHRYPSTGGLPEFRRAVADWYARRFGVDLDPEEEITSLIGSKEGIAHISLCYLEPGAVSLVPDPGYPVYSVGAVMAGGEIWTMPLAEENAFLPDLDAVPPEVWGRVRILWINYPNNPTGAVAPENFWLDLITRARKQGFLICHDAAYSEITYDDYQAPSLLSWDGAREVGIEFHSLSKTYNMTGWRLGWAAGSREAVETLRQLKTNLDSGVFQGIQKAGIAALTEPVSPELIAVYKSRRDLVISSLRDLGWKLEAPQAAIYIWAPVPEGYDSMRFCEHVLEKTGVVITPGVGYGSAGEGYFRIAICIQEDRIDESFRRWSKAGIRYTC